MHAYVCTCIGVSNLRSTRITDTTITVIWDDAVSPNGCGPVFHYSVTIMSSSFLNDMDTQQKRAEYSNLTNGTDYTISVAAVNRVGSGPSSMISVTTSIQSK